MAVLNKRDIVNRGYIGDCVYIGRPSFWGNPFLIGRDGTRAEVIEKHKQFFLSRPDMVLLAKKELRGKHLVCWCAPLPCHGDILYKLANED